MERRTAQVDVVVERAYLHLRMVAAAFLKDGDEGDPKQGRTGTVPLSHSAADGDFRVGPIGERDVADALPRVHGPEW